MFNIVVPHTAEHLSFTTDTSVLGGLVSNSCRQHMCQFVAIISGAKYNRNKGCGGDYHSACPLKCIGNVCRYHWTFVSVSHELLLTVRDSSRAA
ncbi:hypothetical protein EG68_03336 [Paragonimus skrjabini miyazakii]|uniref:Uncharacterized protein n=1 Tax=Paragonimus skrjabini miyazakii TaxID=59628 RepID=A0A8S9YWG2_9TREM|nr:hypothetical protein EG68_03336 [Paragonimus skrjabini miyazakii]